MPRSSRLRRALAALLVPLAAAGAVLVASPAAAVVDPDGPGLTDPAGAGTESTIVQMVHAGGLYGGTARTATATTPYPSSGLTDFRSVSTAIMLLDDPLQPGGQYTLAYCIDLDTETEIGVHYTLGQWTEANVPNLPYVQWILNNYFPNVLAPTGTDVQKVQAVQGAIWYFTDQFVVPSAYPAERNAVRAIVEAAQTALAGGVPPAPPLPTLEITPASADLPDTADVVVGPFTVTGTATNGVLSSSGVRLFSDAAGTVEVVNGSTVAPGTKLWARYDSPVSQPGFSVTANQTVQAGNVYLYDGNNPGRTSAQKLVLAANATVPIRAAVALDVFAAGTLTVDLTVAGDAAGAQSALALTTTCGTGAGAITRPIAVPAGVTGTSTVATVLGVPAGLDCTVDQSEDGANADAVLQSSVIEPATVEITDGGVAKITVTNTYAAPVTPTGELRVEVVVAGEAAGEQSAVELEAVCEPADASGARIEEQFELPAGTGAGRSTVAVLTAVSAGSDCVVTQLADGANEFARLASSSIVPASVTIAADEPSTITVTNTYDSAVVPPTPTPTPTPTPAPAPTPAPVPADHGGLASAGTNVLLPMIGAGVLLVAGAVVLLVLRRRRSN